MARKLTLGSLERIVANELNGLRAELGVPPFTTIDACYLAASLIIAYTAEPFEYPRTDWPAKVRLVGPGLWEPAADRPAWLDDISQPLVLVTCSTLFQNDRKIAEITCETFEGRPVTAVLTTSGIDPATLTPPPNVRVERFVPHSLVLDHAACTVCHAGMGITQKSLAHGVPVVAIPFGRDQPEVARRVEVGGAGVRLSASKPTPTHLRRAVHDAMKLRAGAQRIAAAFAAAGGPAAAADALTQLVSVPPAVAPHTAGVRPPPGAASAQARPAR